MNELRLKLRALTSTGPKQRDLLAIMHEGIPALKYGEVRRDEQ